MSKKNRKLNKLSLATLIHCFKKKFGGQIIKSDIKTVTEILEDQTIFKNITGIITILNGKNHCQFYDLTAKVFIQTVDKVTNNTVEKITRITRYYYELHNTQTEEVISKHIPLIKEKNLT